MKVWRDRRGDGAHVVPNGPSLVDERACACELAPQAHADDHWPTGAIGAVDARPFGAAQVRAAARRCAGAIAVAADPAHTVQTAAINGRRSEARRVGKEYVSHVKSRWTTSHHKKKK